MAAKIKWAIRSPVYTYLYIYIYIYIDIFIGKHKLRSAIPFRELGREVRSDPVDYTERKMHAVDDIHCIRECFVWVYRTTRRGALTWASCARQNRTGQDTRLARSCADWGGGTHYPLHQGMAGRQGITAVVAVRGVERERERESSSSAKTPRFP